MVRSLTVAVVVAVTVELSADVVELVKLVVSDCVELVVSVGPTSEVVLSADAEVADVDV